MTGAGGGGESNGAGGDGSMPVKQTQHAQSIYVMPHMKRDHKAVLELYIPLESA